MHLSNQPSPKEPGLTQLGNFWVHLIHHQRSTADHHYDQESKVADKKIGSWCCWFNEWWQFDIIQYLLSARPHDEGSCSLTSTSPVFTTASARSWLWFNKIALQRNTGLNDIRALMLAITTYTTHHFGTSYAKGVNQQGCLFGSLQRNFLLTVFSRWTPQRTIHWVPSQRLLSLRILTYAMQPYRLLCLEYHFFQRQSSMTWTCPVCWFVKKQRNHPSLNRLQAWLDCSFGSISKSENLLHMRKYSNNSCSYNTTGHVTRSFAYWSVSVSTDLTWKAVSRD